ncbi:UDP-glycosyltransferase 73C6 [Hordeum vulgare]|nr:UDP-glycosyltransferase 73C6 [Hordeum vulgare]
MRAQHKEYNARSELASRAAYLFNIAQNLLKGEEKKTKKGNIKKGRPFTLPHCYEELKDDEKWKKLDNIDDVDGSNKRKKTIELDHDEEEASSDDSKRSPTPNSVSYSKPKLTDGCKKDAKEEKKRKWGDELKNAMEAIVKAIKEENEVRKMVRTQDDATEKWRLAAEKRTVVAEERKVTLEEMKVAMEERSRLLEWEKYLFFLDTSTLNEAQNEYINLTRKEVLIQKRAILRSMGGGGVGGMGAMSASEHLRAALAAWVAMAWAAWRRWHWRHGSYVWLRSTSGRHWRHGMYEFCVSHGRHGSTSVRHGRHVFRCANTFA